MRRCHEWLGDDGAVCIWWEESGEGGPSRRLKAIEYREYMWPYFAGLLRS